MIKLKTAQEIEVLAAGGKILAQILEELSREARPGVTSQEIDELAKELMKKYGVESSFLGYESRGHEPYPAVTCVSVNEGVVHGIPGKRKFESGDLAGLDCGIIYEGLYLDAARTVPIGEVSSEALALLEVTREALRLGIEQARVGNKIGDISEAIQTYIEDHGFGVVTQLVGHGVGYSVHEDPQVPNFGEAGKGPKIEAGLVIAIEPMVTAGKPHVITGKDGWTIETADKSLSAHEEDTIAVTAQGPQVLTRV